MFDTKLTNYLPSNIGIIKHEAQSQTDVCRQQGAKEH